MRKLIREPLLLFILAGALIFLLDLTIGKEDQQGLGIDVTDGEVKRLAELWRVQMGSPPTPQQLEGLTEDWVREEIYYREALRLRLDENDTIIRRRLVQKLGFLTEDTADNADADDAVLEAFYGEHRDTYQIPARFTFSHIYFAHREPEPSDRVDQALAALSRANNWRELGDAFMLNLSYAERTGKEIGSLFGAEFVKAIPSLPLDTWSGPVTSAYGIHLVRLEARLEPVLPGYDQVRDRVRKDFGEYRRQMANQAYYEKLRKRYTVNPGRPASPQTTADR
jgi:hypothetical protein